MDLLVNELTHLSFYQFILKKKVFKSFYQMLKKISQEESGFKEAQADYFKLKRDYLDFCLQIKIPLAETGWKNYIISLLLSQKPITFSILNNKILFKNTLLDELSLFSRLYNLDFTNIVAAFDKDNENVFNKKLFKVSSLLDKALVKEDSAKILKELERYLKKHGLGLFRDHFVFRVEKGENLLVPVEIGHVKTMDDIYGYQKQKEALIQNTKALIEKSGGLNTLLYGDMGTGKSTMIRALTQYFRDTPLRFIELKKENLNLLPQVFETIKKESYPFIILLDDLSFDEADTSYRDLKNAIEGALETQPENVLIYATSNKRTLVSQSLSERSDAISAREIIEEKLSLVSRFGLSLNFRILKPEDYFKMIEFFLNKEGIEFDEKLREQAKTWEIRHLNRSGRSAEQFVKFIKTQP